MQQQGAGALEENVEELSIQDILELQCRNRAKDEEACLFVPLADALKGQGHVAWKPIQDINGGTSNDFAFNDEQILVIALQVWPLEQAWRGHKHKMQSASATVDTLRKLPNDLGKPRMQRVPPPREGPNVLDRMCCYNLLLSANGMATAMLRRVA